MASVNKMGNDYTNVNSITLKNGLLLRGGVLALSGTVNGVVNTTTILTTVPTTLVTAWSLSEVVFNFTDTTGIGGTLTASIGTNSATYDNIMPSTTFTGWNSINDLFRYKTTGVCKKLYNTEVIRINITGAFSGSSVTFEVSFLGDIL